MFKGWPGISGMKTGMEKGINRHSPWLRLAALCLLLCSPCACSQDSGPDIGQAAPVHVAQARKGNLPRSIDAVGNVRASASVAITPRVAGEIVAVNFTEGQNVLAGESILEIDPRPYSATLAEKRANLLKSRAQLNKAQKDRSRFGRLVREGYISREAYDQTETDAAVLAATVEADAAAVRRAELDLSYCSIIAPISGRIGELKMHKGNMVKDNDTGPVCAIDTISPCYVDFSVPETHLGAIFDQLRAGELPVVATPIGGKSETGKLSLVDNSVDVKTGAIHLRATFANASGRLWPGQFVEIRLPLGEFANAVIVPDRAIQTGKDESYLYVVTPDNRAEYRKVRVLLARDGETAVEGQLEPGEQVITAGQVRLAPGLPVQIMP